LNVYFSAISITCDFGQPYGCGYLFGDFTRREAFRHHLPAVDHTFGNDSSKSSTALKKSFKIPKRGDQNL